MPWIGEYREYLTEEQSLNNAQLVVNHFVGSDWSKESLSALLGNMRHESHINPKMYEHGYTWEEDRGYGLVQWTPRSKFWNWAIENGLDPEDANSQLARIDYEVDNNIQWIPRQSYNGMTFKEFRTNSGKWTVEYLTEAFTWGYERPNQTAGEESMVARKNFALKSYNTLDFTGTNDSGGGTGEHPKPEETNNKIYHLWLSGVMRW